MQSIAEQERRQTASAQDAATRKIRSLEQERARLEGLHREEAERGLEYEEALARLREEMEGERRTSMVN